METAGQSRESSGAVAEGARRRGGRGDLAGGSIRGRPETCKQVRGLARVVAPGVQFGRVAAAAELLPGLAPQVPENQREP